MHDTIELIFVIPYLNEAPTLAAIIADCHRCGIAAKAGYEVIASDNVSRDCSIEIDQQHDARVVSVPQRGYGAALQAGIQAAWGQFVLMGDADSTFRFDQAPLFLARLRGVLIW